MALDEVKIEHAGKSGGKRKVEDLENAGKKAAVRALGLG